MKKIHLCYFIPLVLFTLGVFNEYGISRAFFNDVAFMLLFIGIVGSAVAGFCNHTVIAVISGIAILMCGLNAYKFNDYSWALASLLAICVNFTVAFMVHIKKASSKLRIFYFIPTAIFIFLLHTQLYDFHRQNGDWVLYRQVQSYIFLLFVIAMSAVAGLKSICSNTPPRPSVPGTLLFDENTISLPADSNKNPHDL